MIKSRLSALTLFYLCRNKLYENFVLTSLPILKTNNTSVDERIPPLIIFVKAWAKAQDINSAFMGTLSSYLLVSMVIYFLQTGMSPPLLPPLRQYVDNLQSVNVNTQLQTLQPAQFIKFQVRNQESLGEVLAKFFQFWNKKLKQNKVFSVYTAQEKIRTYNQPFLDTSAYVFCVEGSCRAFDFISNWRRMWILNLGQMQICLP